MGKDQKRMVEWTERWCLFYREFNPNACKGSELFHSSSDVRTKRSSRSEDPRGCAAKWHSVRGRRMRSQRYFEARPN